MLDKTKKRFQVTNNSKKFSILEKLFKTEFKIKKEFKITDISMNSQNIIEGSVFFAINKGNNFIESAIEKGAILVVADKVSDDVYASYQDSIIKVENTVKTMQELAKKYRQLLNIKVVGITGSNGKTSTKDILHAIALTSFVAQKTQGNYNNEIGLPYTILNLEDRDQIVILELGMSSFGEIDLLGEISKPDYAIITNIGESHLEHLKTRENIFKAKTEILKHIAEEKVFVCGDDDLLKNLRAKKIGFSAANNSLIKNFSTVEKNEKNFITFDFEGEKYFSNLMGQHSAINIALAISVARELAIEKEKIKLALEDIKITKMRFQIEDIGRDKYINDAYNASPTSMKASLDTFSDLFNNRYKIAILGDMLELGSDELDFHKTIINFARTKKIDKIFLYGERMLQASSDIEDAKITKFYSQEDIIQELENIKDEKAVLLKSSNGVKLFEIIEKIKKIIRERT